MIVCKSVLARSVHFKYIAKCPLLANAGGGPFCVHISRRFTGVSSVLKFGQAMR
nr:MAG TPA: hypothetical protein [Caudoviricetes sp.]